MKTEYKTSFGRIFNMLVEDGMRHAAAGLLKDAFDCLQVGRVCVETGDTELHEIEEGFVNIKEDLMLIIDDHDGQEFDRLNKLSTVKPDVFHREACRIAGLTEGS